jgi:prevent-host-death family protein
VKTISVGQLRQNPTEALAEVERGEVYAVTRHNREIAHLVPVRHTGGATPEQAMAIYRHSPLADDSWSTEVAADRAAIEAEDRGDW